MSNHGGRGRRSTDDGPQRKVGDAAGSARFVAADFDGSVDPGGAHAARRSLGKRRNRQRLSCLLLRGTMALNRHGSLGVGRGRRGIPRRGGRTLGSQASGPAPRERGAEPLTENPSGLRGRHKTLSAAQYAPPARAPAEGATLAIPPLDSYSFRNFAPPRSPRLPLTEPLWCLRGDRPRGA